MSSRRREPTYDPASSARPHGARSSSQGLLEPSIERPINVKTAAVFLGVSPSVVYAWVERKQIPHYRMMGRAIRFRLSELADWREQFHVTGGIE